jgi:galacturonosyltransferase
LIESILHESKAIYSKNELFELLLLKFSFNANMGKVVFGMHTLLLYPIVKSLKEKIHNYLYSSKFYLGLLSKSRLHFPTHSKSSDMISDQPWSKGRYYIIPNPIDIDRFSLKQFGKKEFLDIYYIGRLVETKGVDLLLEAISIISDEEFFKQIRFYIVGEGPMEDRVKELFSKHKNCFYLGFRKDIPELLKKVDLLILPSRYESFSYVVAEAQSEGVIVLSSNIEGPKDILNDNLTGWFFESGNTEDLAKKLSQYIIFGNLTIQK